MEARPRRATILVVDDDPLVLDYAETVLKGAGYEVLTAPDGAAALGLVRHSGGGIDLLFTDIVMPGLDGFEVARQARDARPGLKVLFTSGYASGLERADRLLKKPYRPQQLADEIAAALDEN
jgi:CheY-like chemotaxis protein